MITTLQYSNLNTGIKRASVWKALSFLMLNLLLGFSVQAQTVVEPFVGQDATPTLVTNARQPLTNFWRFERSAAIYSATEIGTSGTITAIAYDLKAIKPTAALSIPVRIFMKQVASTSFAGSTTVATEESGAQLVFDGVVTINPGTTWQTITLTTPFVYDLSSGTPHLEVIVETNCPTCPIDPTGSSGLDPEQDSKVFRFNNLAANSFQYWYDDFDPIVFTSDLTSYRPNIQLTITPSGTPVCQAPTGVSVVSNSPNTITASYTPSGGLAGDYFLTYGTTTVQLTSNPQTITSVPAGNYSYTLYKQCGTTQMPGGTGTVLVSDPTLTCDAPSGLSATNITSNSADLNFTPSSTGATGTYTIEYGTSGFTPGTGTQITGVTTSPRNVTGLLPSTNYQFYVTKNCSGGNSTTVGPAAFATTAAPILTCAAPTIVNGTGTGQTTATVTFSGGDAGTSYTIQYGPTNGPFPTGSTTTAAAGSPASLTGLTAGTAYTFVVRTTCSNGVTSADSPQGTFTTNPVPVSCDAPTNLNATNITQTTATINFTATSPGDTYTVEYGPTGFSPNTPGSGASTAGPVSASPINISGLTAGTTYDFYITRQCQNGFTTVGPASFTTQSATVTCDDPTNLFASNITQTSASLNFTLNGTGGTYTLEFDEGSLGFAQGAGTTITGLTASPFNLSGLDPATTYQFYVTKNCSGNNSNRIGPVVFTTQSTTPQTCAAPTTVSGNGFRNGTAQLTFSGGDPGTNELQYTTDPTFNSGIVSVNPATSPTNLSGLAPGTYSFRVRTTCTNNVVSSFSPIDTFIIAQPATLTCAEPTTVNGLGTSQTTAQVTFSGGDAGASYTIQYGPSATFPAGSTTTTAGGSPATITGLTANTQYTFVVRTTCTNGVVSADSPQGTFTTTQTPPACVAGTWLGTTSSDWHTAANWCNGVIPDGTTNVLIPASTGLTPVPNYPIISANAFTNNLIIEAGATLTLSSGLLTINGLYTNLGTLIDNGDGSLAFTSGLPQTIGKPGNVITFLDLTIGPGGAVQAGPVRVRRMLTLNGNLTTAGNELTLLADNVIQSMVVNVGAAVVIGTATMEKHITGGTPPAGNPSFGYRHLSSPVSNAAIAQLNDDTPLIVNPAYNTNPATANPFPNIYRYNETRVTPANPIFDAGWESPASLGEPMLPGEGFTVNMLPVEVDFTGELNNGPITRTLTRANPGVVKSGWNFLGNPYPAPLNWDEVNLPADVDRAAYVFRSTGQYTGAYVAYVNGIPANGEYIAAMQGFFVRANAPSTAITFDNSDRAATYQNPLLYKQADTRPQIALTITNSAGKQDQTYVYFQQGATVSFDRDFDAFKLPSSGPVPSIFSIAGSDQLAINGLPLSNATTIIPLGGKVPQAGTWTIQADQILNFLPNQTIYLEDMATSTLHNLSQQNSYTFSTTATDLTGRFFLRFGPGATTGITPAELAAKVMVYPNPNNGQFTISMPSLNSPAIEAALYNAVGQKVWNKTMQTNGAHFKETISTPTLPAGVYTLRLETAAGPVQRKIIIE